MSQKKQEEAAKELVNIAVKSMGGHYASTGVVIETNADRCCPKLKPGDVIQVPIDHVIVNHPSTEVTSEPPNRPVRYADSVQASLAGSRGDDHRELERLSMLQGAVDDRLKKLAERQAAHAAAVSAGVPVETQREMEVRIREEMEAKLAEADGATANRKNQHVRENPRDAD